jgi:hypothetical protein
MMHVFHIAVFAAAALAVALGFYFIVCQRYEEGLFGNLFSGFLLIVPGGVFVWDAVGFGMAQALDGNALPVMTISLVALLTRHAVRSMLFHWAPRLGWKTPRDATGPCAPPSRTRA